MFNYQKFFIKPFEHGKATMESNFGLLLCPKSIKKDLSKTVHFGKYYFNKLQLNFKK
jgi:hypothetical protein